MEKSEVKISDLEIGQGLYDMRCELGIVDHPRHGRLLLAQGFGGVDSLAGGAYRWRHGCVIRLQEGDTLESLRQEAWNEQTTTLQAALGGYDPSRPFLKWEPHVIESAAMAWFGEL